jgi:Protein of unknown function (DUF2842)
MGIRTRKLIGTIAMVLLVPVYALIAMALAQGRITEAPGWLQAILYAGLGIVIKWMENGRIRG